MATNKMRLVVIGNGMAGIRTISRILFVAITYSSQ